jgi:sulfatase maturation enzyme AslB (radical SAM superfamily)
VRLDALLSRLSGDWPGYFADDVTVTMTLSSASLPHLAASVRYFLDRRVPSFTVSPIDTHDPGWDDRSLATLDRQLKEASALCRRRFVETGAIPFQLLRRHRRNPRRPARGGAPMCRIAEGDGVCVDVDGEITACGAFARSLVAPPTGLAAAAFAGARLGHVRNRDVLKCLEVQRRAVADQPAFSTKERKHSPYAQCARCDAFAECRVCPAAIVNQPGNLDPDAVPPLPCAFTLLSAKHRRRFQAWRRTEAVPAPV